MKQQIFPGMFAQTQVTCNDCGGRGKIVKKVCPHCRGSKIVDHTAHFTLEVEKGCPEGHEVVFDGEADESPDWEAGDVILRVRSRKAQGGFKRKETSLYWTETIGVDEVGDLIVVECPLFDQAPPTGIARIRAQAHPLRWSQHHAES